MTYSEIKDEIRNIVMGFPDFRKDFKDTDLFIVNGIIDSQEFLELIMTVETKFNIKIDDTEMLPANVGTVENLAGFVLDKKGA